MVCAGAVLASIGVPAFALAAGLAARFGILATLPFIPLLWLAVGAALCLACVLTKRLVGPRLSPRHPIPVFSGRFARWWLVRSTFLPPAHMCVITLQGRASFEAAVSSLRTEAGFLKHARVCLAWQSV